MLTPLDLIILAVLGFGMYRGATKGFLKNASTVFSIVAGVIFGARLAPLAESLFLDYLRVQIDPKMLSLLSLVTAFVVVFVIFSALFNQISNALEKTNFELNNALGAVFGGFLAALALSVAFKVMTPFGFPSQRNQQESVLYPYVEGFSFATLGYGAEALSRANQRFNQFGKEKQDNQMPANTQPTNKPKPIR
ncbi:MAG: CvpA family protein [Bacteroidota bacterium]